MTGTDVPNTIPPTSPHTEVATRLLDGRVTAAGPAVSPDGQRIAFVVATIDLAENTTTTRVWLAGPTATRRRSPPAPTTPARCGRRTAAGWPSARGAARRTRRRRCTSCRSTGPARCARSSRCPTASPTWPGRPTASGWRSPAAPATPATRPRTSAGSRRARSRRSSPASTTRAGCSTAPSTCTSWPPTAPAPSRNLTPGPYQHDGVSWLADSSASSPARPATTAGTATCARTSTSCRSTARSAP